MGSTHRVEVIRMEGGERFPLLVCRATGVPDAWACRYSLTYHRTRAVKTGERELTAVGRLHDWVVEEGIDLDGRFGSGDLFSAAEIERLSDSVRVRKELGRPGKWVKRQRIVVGDTHKDRMRTITKYVQWRMSHVMLAIVDIGHTQDVRLRLREMGEQVKGLVRGSKQVQREALTDEELQFLVAVTHPKHPLNPFTRRTRERNYAIILLYVELGVREGEPLVLKGPHLQLNGSKPRIVIVPNPHDPDDHRADAPQVKTNGRSLPTSRPLTRALDHYVKQVRPKERNSKKQQFVFLGTRTGAPISLDAIYDIFRVLRRRFPDRLPANLSAHLLRHTWNSRFRTQAKKRGWDEGFRDIINNYLMGWSKTSEQSTRYGYSQITREAEDALLALQVGMEAMA